MRITLIEDNRALRKGILYRLTDDGHAVDELSDGDEAEQFLRQETSDLILLDINLPGKSGLEILADLRSRGDPRPVILLTARSGIEERVMGLDTGADDYLVKPFEMDELAARIRAVSRRKDVAPKRAISIGALRLDPEVPQLTHEGDLLDIPRRELMLLVALAEAGGAPLSKDRLLDHIYGVGSDVDEKVVEVYVSRLRKRMLPYGSTIRSQRGIGYALAQTDE